MPEEGGWRPHGAMRERTDLPQGPEKGLMGLKAIIVMQRANGAVGDVHAHAAAEALQKAGSLSWALEVFLQTGDTVNLELS